MGNFSKINDLQQLIDNLKNEKDTAHQRAQYTESIENLQREYRILTKQQEDLKNITIYIRKQGEMRYSLIVDPIQTNIKTQNLFDGTTLIINGGPGTGKSTTMIHRLAYLTDKFAIEEDKEGNYCNYKLDALQRSKLKDAISRNRDWMFFSPSQNLREYLATAMIKEGLSNTYQKVWNWKDYCRNILQANYRILGGDASKAPFRVSYKDGTLFYQGYNIVNELIEFFTNQLRNINSKLPKLNTDGIIFEWTSIAKSIGKRLEESINYDLGKFISLFISLQSVYGDDCKKLLREKNKEINNLANDICILLDENSEAKTSIEDLLDLTAEVEDEDEIMEEEELNDSEDEEMVEIQALSDSLDSDTFTSNLSNEAADDKRHVNPKLKMAIVSWLKAYSYSMVNNQAHLSDIQQLLCEILVPIMEGLDNTKIQKIGQMMVFEQYARYTRGVDTILLNSIPTQYKKFRSYLIKNKYKGCDLKLLRDIMQENRGKKLHHQELSLLLGFINTVVKQIKVRKPNIEHVYIKAYDEVSRPIIGIDEATDFSLCDIYAMQSLLAQEFNSLTLCGDMMQRLTTYGIKSWSELNDIVSNPIVVEMKTSYRQSKKLLEVARKIYTDTLGKKPTYTAFMKSNKVPAPLVYVDGSEHLKIDWISKRISEVYRAYGEQMPSIAIFVNDKGYIPYFIDNLKSMEFFKQNGIQVIDGSKEKPQVVENYIGVYPIDSVKGMEFDVVFFHNIDNSSVDNELLKRYIYVGVSRAAFFLGITLSEENKEITQYFEENKDWFNI